MMITPSDAAVASRLPSALQATSLMMSRWPLRVVTIWPDPTFQSLTVWSSLAVARSSPSGLNATEPTESLCPAQR